MGCVIVQILRYEVCDNADTALWSERLCACCAMDCVTVQILRYSLCECANTAFLVV